MNLKSTRQPTDKKTTSVDEQILKRCLAVKDLEERGDYEAARRMFGKLWQRIGEQPVTDGLGELVKAEVLLRVGALSGWMGSSQGIDGAQEFAQNLISESARLFAAAGAVEKEAEALIDLALCYWHTGAYDEARVILNDVLQRIAGRGFEQEGRAYYNLSAIELKASRFHEALRVLTAAASFFESNNNPAAKGRFFMNLALAHRNLAEIEQREDYFDLALTENAGAISFLEQAGHMRFAGRVENNTGETLIKMGRYDEAHPHLDRAHQIFVDLKDTNSVAQVNETRAQVLIAQGRYAEAERLSFGAVHALEHGDQFGLLAEALITHGVAVVRMGREDKALSILQRAVSTATEIGDTEVAGRACIVMLEELSHQLTPDEILATYRRADELLAKSTQSETLARLRACARTALSALEKQKGQMKLADLMVGGKLPDEVLRYEAELIRQALDEAGGGVSAAAEELGITHQTLSMILTGRHRHLLHARTPIQTRRRSIIPKKEKA